MSPTIHRERGYAFYFVSFDIASGEPPHIHASAGRAQPRGDAKFWLEPVQLASPGRFGQRDLRAMQAIIEERQREFLEEWYDY